MGNIAYKLFRVSVSYPGKLFPLYVNSDKETKIGEWLDAECGELTKNGKVKSRLGELCYRPGWHLSDLPYATHIGVKNDQGIIEFMKPDTVWCECEYSDETNYQLIANKNGINRKGKLVEKNAYLTKIPVNGFYRYKTNPNMYGNWIIAGSIKINRVLSDEEVKEILINHGLKPMERYKGNFNCEKYGFEKEMKVS